MLPGPVDCKIDDRDLFCWVLTLNNVLRRRLMTIDIVWLLGIVCVCVYGSSLLSESSSFTMMTMHVNSRLQLCRHTNSLLHTFTSQLAVFAYCNLRAEIRPK